MTFTNQFIEGVTLKGAVIASESCTKRSVTTNGTLNHLIAIVIVTSESACFRRLVKMSLKCCGRKSLILTGEEKCYQVEPWKASGAWIREMGNTNDQPCSTPERSRC
jgi:hypothetical protein